VRPRQKRYRERLNNGRGVWRVENDITNLEHLLETAKLLPAGTDHSHADVQAALDKVIDLLINETLTRQDISGYEVTKPRPQLGESILALLA
jgi:hypothetical protein